MTPCTIEDCTEEGLPGFGECMLHMLGATPETMERVRLARLMMKHPERMHRRTTMADVRRIFYGGSAMIIDDVEDMP